MVKHSSKITHLKGGDKLKKLSLALALVFAFMLTIGVTVALAAPGDYPPDSTSGQYTSTLNGTEGKTDSSLWGLSNGITNANQTGKNRFGYLGQRLYLRQLPQPARFLQ